VTWRALAGDLTTTQIEALHTLFDAAPGQEDLSRLAWLRQFPAAPGARSLHALIERLDVVRTLGVERRRQIAIPAVAFDTVATDAMAMTVQNLRVLAPLPRRALLVAAALRLETDLTDAALFMFDRLMGRVARKAERASADGAAAAMRGVQDHLKTLARAGRAVIAAHETDGDVHDAIDHAVGWARLPRAPLQRPRVSPPASMSTCAPSWYGDGRRCGSSRPRCSVPSASKGRVAPRDC
jgi:hypothetical protein